MFSLSKCGGKVRGEANHVGAGWDKNCKQKRSDQLDEQKRIDNVARKQCTVYTYPSATHVLVTECVDGNSR